MARVNLKADQSAAVTEGQEAVAEPYIEFSTVRVIKPVTDLSTSATAGTVDDSVPVGIVGTIVDIHNQPNFPLAYEVEFSEFPDEQGWRLQAILHDELEVVWSPDPAPSRLQRKLMPGRVLGWLFILGGAAILSPVVALAIWASRQYTVGFSRQFMIITGFAVLAGTTCVVVGGYILIRAARQSPYL